MDIALAGAVDRRAFLKASLVAGVAVVVRPLTAAAQAPAFEARIAAADSGWRRTPTTAARRIDGPPKVTGAKLYAADFRARDMPGWPGETAQPCCSRLPTPPMCSRGSTWRCSTASSYPIGWCSPPT
jgi:hypothetical protein